MAETAKEFPPVEVRSIVAEVAGLLRERGESVCVAETAAGGIISASLLSTPGASKFYKGGLTLYTLESRIAFGTFLSSPLSCRHLPSPPPPQSSSNRHLTPQTAGWTPENLTTYRGPTPEIVSGLATNVRPKLGATYCVAESGTAGPTGGNTRNRTPNEISFYDREVMVVNTENIRIICRFAEIICSKVRLYTAFRSSTISRLREGNTFCFFLYFCTVSDTLAPFSQMITLYEPLPSSSHSKFPKWITTSSQADTGNRDGSSLTSYADDEEAIREEFRRKMVESFPSLHLSNAISHLLAQDRGVTSEDVESGEEGSPAPPQPAAAYLLSQTAHKDNSALVFCLNHPPVIRYNYLILDCTAYRSTEQAINTGASWLHNLFCSLASAVVFHTIQPSNFEFLKGRTMSSSECDEFEVIDQLEASLAPEELRRVQEWLEPTDSNAQSSEFRRHLYSQAPGTGLWICQTSKYEQWLKSADHGSIWIKGVPGAGKSVTAASIIHHLRSTSTTPVLYFFFRHIISANRRPRCLIRDFLAQLLPHSTRLQATLQPLLGTTLEDISDEILWQYLLTGLASIEKAYCVIDALDELELLPNDGFLERLNNLATFRPGAVKVLMTSRPKQYLQACLRGSSIVHISLEDDLVSKDINLFLSHRLNNLIPRNDQQRLKESLISIVTERSRGLFLYARLLLDQIIPVLGSKQLDIETLAKSLPVGLEQMYNSMLFQQAESLKIDTQVQVFLLQWATHSSRALRLNELASVLASIFPPSMIPENPKFVARSACAPLLEISEDETVQVIHHSFTEFLLNKERVQYENPGQTTQFPVLDPERVHNKLSVACLDYLRSGALRLENNQNSQGDASCLQWPSRSDRRNKKKEKSNYQEAKLRYPFLGYAVANWAFHASKYDVEDEEFYRCVAEFLDPKSVDFRTWLELEWIGGQKSVEFQAPAPLHIAAFAGLTTYARTLIEGGVSVNLGDGEDRTPLHWACARGHTSMAALLLEGGANANAEDVRGVKPIHEAARKNHATVVKLLLDAGVDPLTPKTRENQTMRIMCGQVSTIGETAVEYAYLQGHTDTLMAILLFLTPEALEEMFCQCCRYGKFEAVRAILQNSNVSPNSKSCGATALYLACRVHSAHIVQLLLDKGADVHQTSK
ncbi:hypothetical protein G7Y89_g1908 [Cudoniella acicularis]|uniref:NACHT domain-containing protein n=1 Tax=Cudoniella acicularis TaxID=354080 RepID=A0A8H4RUE7_9HELO|nr:hypothetical protein G7Y89_g1908 [Cudoniella acicularis]